jgi:FixJ family two-component response regulator
MMTGTPAIHVFDYNASCRKAISRLLKLSSGDIAEHDSATSLLRAIEPDRVTSSST